jgi:2-keto-4-pentenoate hydratase/2-oxohepta-3-ene-1,7-dioic acid hydratase in catechol pathway
MKFVTFRKSQMIRAGVLGGDGSGARDSVIDLSHPAMRDALGGVEPHLEAMLEAGLTELIGRITAHGLAPAAQLPLAEVSLMAPLRPGRIFGIAHNYRDAVAERGMTPPDRPVLFMKTSSTVIASGEAIVLPAGIGGVTYEAELAAVIGRRAANVPKQQALEHVAAYGSFNDISASEVIKKDGHFDRGKNFPTFGPFGPFLVSSDEIADPQALTVSLRVDGKVLQQGTTRDMLFGVADLVSLLSQQTTLEPGDVIATGTPAGVAAMHKPPAWLQPGSTVSVRVEGLGHLVNPLIEGPAPDVR